MMHERFLAALVAVQQRLLAHAPERLYDDIVAIIGEAAGADRAYYIAMVFDAAGRPVARPQAEWRRTGIAPSLMSIGDIPIFGGLEDPNSRLRRGESVSLRRSTGHADIVDLMDRTGTQSCVLLPVHVQGKFFGVLGLDALGNERVWKDEDPFLRAAAGALAGEIERRDAIAELRAAHAMLSLHIENSPLGVLEWDQDFRVRRWSTQAERIFGWTAEEVVGKHFGQWRFVHEDDLPAVQQTAADLTQGAGRNISRNRNYTRSGQIVHCEWYNSTLVDADSGQVSVLSLVQDVTEREVAAAELHRVQEQAAQAETMRVVGQMASGVAHDVNNGLTTILGLTELLLHRSDLSDGAREILRDVRTAACDAGQTVRRMQRFAGAHDHPDNKQPLDLSALAREVAGLTRHRWANQAQRDGRTIRLTCEGPEAVWVDANAAELRELLTNLVFNAVDAMPAGGAITLTTGVKLNQAFLEARDTGVGMDDETRRRCFEPFFTTKGVEGTGLGLAVSWSIARRHGGDLTTSSEPNAGSTFVLWLPSSGETTPVSSSVIPSSERSLHVLVVDDQKSVGRAVCRMLESLGHEATLVSGGQEAIERLQTDSCDVVVTDLGMPDVDGFAVAAAAKQHRTDLPVVLLTGWGHEFESRDMASPTIDYVLAKPPTLATLAEALHAVVPVAGELEPADRRR